MVKVAGDMALKKGRERERERERAKVSQCIH
jgi:hypothetical protein